MANRHLGIGDLRRLCDEREQEPLVLEFKACSELRVEKEYLDRQGQPRKRSREDVVSELSKDVTALLNAAGGTIAYGIVEHKSRADRTDCANAFGRESENDIRPERVISGYVRMCGRLRRWTHTASSSSRERLIRPGTWQSMFRREIRRIWPRTTGSTSEWATLCSPWSSTRWLK
jgi:hypothetical protein